MCPLLPSSSRSPVVYCTEIQHAASFLPHQMTCFILYPWSIVWRKQINTFFFNYSRAVTHSSKLNYLATLNILIASNSIIVLYLHNGCQKLLLVSVCPHPHKPPPKHLSSSRAVLPQIFKRFLLIPGLPLAESRQDC